MITVKRTIATTELLLMFPAALFMTALFLREVQPQQFEPAHTAARIVMWYAARPRLGLWVLLIALPLTVLVTSAAMLLRTWNRDVELQKAAREALGAIRGQLAVLGVAMAMLLAAGVLAIVALHLIAT